MGLKASESAEFRGSVEKEEALVERLEQKLRAASPLLLVSPPRGNSSVFATSMGQNSSIDRYIHEPCGSYSHDGLSISSIVDALGSLKPQALIKEMTFQMREPLVARAFLRGCRSPIVFLVRRPLLSIESRMRLVLTDLSGEATTPPAVKEAIEQAISKRSYGSLSAVLTEAVFPLFRTGWSDLGAQLRFCREEGVDYVVVETSEFRRNPTEVLSALCPRIGLVMEPSMMVWAPETNSLPGALDNQAVWYERVTKSSGVQPPDRHRPKPEDLPPRFRAHLTEAMTVYKLALSDASKVIRFPKNMDVT